MDQTNNIVGNPVRWDCHACPAYRVGGDLTSLERYFHSGIDFVSLNVGFDLLSQDFIFDLITYITNWTKKFPKKFTLIKGVEDIYNAKLNQQLSIAFDIEGCGFLNKDLNHLYQLYDLGVRQISFAYNNNNNVGGGCFDIDEGLSDFGKQLLMECNKLGVIIDCSHVGYKTSMEIMELTTSPIIFSHSNPCGLFDHPRNIKDDQIIACAEIGGVIGINGIGIFLGDNDTSSEKIVEHIDYICQLVGTDHVGIGLDFIFNEVEVKDFVINNPSTFPNKYGFENVCIARPEQFSEINVLLSRKGYSQADIDNILGENFFRIAKTVWR